MVLITHSVLLLTEANFSPTDRVAVTRRLYDVLTKNPSWKSLDIGSYDGGRLYSDPASLNVEGRTIAKGREVGEQDCAE